jgi:hypothetical protein
MTDSVPQVVTGAGDDGRPVVLVETGGEIADLAGLIAVAGLMQADAAEPLAIAVNHLAQGSDFRVIADPAAYEAAYRARLAQEDPAQPWRQGVFRLVDYGVPDFGTIEPPALKAQVLTFFAEHASLGIPYRVEADLGAAAPVVNDDSYRPLPLAPVAGAALDEQPGELSDEMKALHAAMRTVPADS